MNARAEGFLTPAPEGLSQWLHLGPWEPCGGVWGFFMGSRGRNGINLTLYPKRRLLTSSGLEFGVYNKLQGFSET